MSASTKTPTISQLTRCPECKSNWDAGTIFDALRPQAWCADKSDDELQKYIDLAYGTDKPQCFSRLIGVSSLELDRVVAWECPDCKHRWPRN